MYNLCIIIKSTNRKLLKKAVRYILSKINNCEYNICYVNMQYNDIRGGYCTYHYMCDINIHFNSKSLNTITILTYLLNHVNKFVNIQEMKIYEIDKKG